MNRDLRARAILAEMDAMGVTLEDVSRVSTATPERGRGPIVVEYLEVVAGTYKSGTARAYGSYWKLLVTLHGDRPIASITYDDCAAVLEAAAARSARRGSEGSSARETCVAALRAYFERARRSGLIILNPAAELEKPRRRPNRRRGLTDSELDQLRGAVAETSRDPRQDLLLVEFHLQTGARRQGALSLQLKDVDSPRSTVWLHEKFGLDREQPITPSLLAAVVDLARQRGAAKEDDYVFRSGRRVASVHQPLSRRHYNTLFDRAQARLEWAPRTPVTAHVLRHTSVTRVERIAGMAVAAAFAGHRPATVTAGYAKASVEEVATALARLTGEDHPLASLEA